MTRLLTRSKERRIWRVPVAYPGVPYVMLQAVRSLIDERVSLAAKNIAVLTRATQAQQRKIEELEAKLER